MSETVGATGPQKHTVLLAVDFAAQPSARFVVVCPNAARTLIAIDGWQIDNGAFVGYVEVGAVVNGEVDFRPVVSFEASRDWLVLARTHVRAAPLDDRLREDTGRGAVAAPEPPVIPVAPDTVVPLESNVGELRVGQYL